MVDIRNSGILVVDDSEYNVDILMDTLSDTYTVSCALDGETALSMAALTRPDLILLDVMMPGMDGFAVCAHLKADPVTRDIPVIFLTAVTADADKERAFELGAVDYMVKPFSLMEVRARVRVHLSLQKALRELRERELIMSAKACETIRDMTTARNVLLETAFGLAQAPDADAARHILRVRAYVRLLASVLLKKTRFADFFRSCTPEEVAQAATFHDIGKLRIPDALLQKPGSLTPEEFAVVKTHAELGEEVFRKACERTGLNRCLELTAAMAASHHERFDGKGYPKGTAGDAVPPAGRIMALVDAYDAMVNGRVYKAAVPHENAVKEITAQKGLQFDPDVVDAFLSVADQFPQITQRYAVNAAPENASLDETPDWLRAICDDAEKTCGC